MRVKKWIAWVLVLFFVVTVLGCSNEKPDEAETTTGGGDVSEGETTVNEIPEEEVVLNFWYVDANMTDYFTGVIESYQTEHPNVTVNMRIVASTGYLDNINTQSINHSNAVDIYMLHNEDLEQAYLAGLARAYDPEGTVYTEENYGKSALRAITYDNKRIAYPLYFDGAFLVYNKDYVETVPTTFDGILGFATMERGEEESVMDNIEIVCVWPVSDYSFNYEFLSDGLIVGGINGDSRSQVDVENGTVIAALQYFQSLNDYFALDRNEVDYEYCLNYFMEGKSAFTFAKTAALTRLSESEINFGTACMPDISDTISASALSYTQCLVINPYSTNVAEAEKFVKALSYDYASQFYGQTGYYPSCKAWEYDDIVRGIYENYFDSTPMPKMMTLGDYYIELDILLHKVWDDEGDIATLLNEFQNFLNVQLNE